MSVLVTAHLGNNADLIREVSAFYVKDGTTVADVTYGKGAFWRKTDTSRFSLLPSDLVTCPDRPYDFCNLPYKSQSVDTVVLDPPYIHNPGNHITDGRYQNAATTKGMYHDDIIRLYAGGIREARRVLRPGGQLWVKCKDQVESSLQKWSHIEIYDLAVRKKFYARDLFVLVPTSRTSSNRWPRQYHARKNHSFLWIFEKP